LLIEKDIYFIDNYVLSNNLTVITLLMKDN